MWGYPVLRVPTLPKEDKAVTSSMEAPTAQASLARLGSKAPDDSLADDDPDLLNFAMVESKIVYRISSQPQNYFQVYIDDIVIETWQGDGLIPDLEESFTNFRCFNIRLNLEKCTLGSLEAKFLGTSSPSVASKGILTRLRPLPKWVKSEMSRMSSVSWGASQPSAILCPIWGNADSLCTSC
jgi:hypothetical protein